MPAEETPQACPCIFGMDESLLIVLLYLSGAFWSVLIARPFRQKTSSFSISTWLSVAFFNAFLLATLSWFKSKLELPLLLTASLIAITALLELAVRLFIEANR